MKRVFALLSSAVLMVVMSFSLLGSPAMAMPQDLVNWCVADSDCDVVGLNNEVDGLTGEVLFHEKVDPKAEAECKRIDTIPSWADQNVEIKDDWIQYFTTENGLIDYSCTLVH